MSRSHERRRWPRGEATPGGPGAAARLRTGGELVIRNASPHGIRVEGPVRLLPGLHVDVHLILDGGRQLRRGRVVWCRVRSVAPLGYAAAFVFEESLELLTGGYRFPCEPAGQSRPEEAAYPGRQPAAAAERESREKLV